jgi:plasmid stability protein
MGSMLIRNFDDELRARLRVRAAQHGRSMEEEVRTILRRELAATEKPPSVVDLFAERFGSERGIDLGPRPAVLEREPPDFGE